MGHVFQFPAKAVLLKIQSVALREDIEFPVALNNADLIFCEALHIKIKYFGSIAFKKLEVGSLNHRLQELGVVESSGARIIYGFLLLEVSEQLGWTSLFRKARDDFSRDYAAFGIDPNDKNLQCCTAMRVLLHFIQAFHAKGGSKSKTLAREVVGHFCEENTSAGGKRLANGAFKVHKLNKFFEIEGKCPPVPRSARQPVPDSSTSTPHCAAAPSVSAITLASAPSAMQMSTIDSIRIEVSDAERDISSPSMTPHSSFDEWRDGPDAATTVGVSAGQMLLAEVSADVVGKQRSAAWFDGTVDGPDAEPFGEVHSPSIVAAEECEFDQEFRAVAQKCAQDCLGDDWNFNDDLSVLSYDEDHQPDLLGQEGNDCTDEASGPLLESVGDSSRGGGAPAAKRLCRRPAGYPPGVREDDIVNGCVSH